MIHSNRFSRWSSVLSSACLLLPFAALPPMDGEFTTVASWYGPGFQGRKTASGETFDPNKMTAASKTLPFGTKVTVKNLRNGKTCKVVINDRGPYIQGRGIDLSHEAARRLGIDGIAPVLCSTRGVSERNDSDDEETERTNMLPPIAPRYRSSQTEALQSSGSGADLDSPDAPPLEQRRDISNSEPELSVLKRQPAQSAQSAQSIARSDDFQKSDLQVDSKQNASQNFDRRNPVPMSQGLNRSASSANAPSLPSSGAPQNGVPGGSAATEAAIGTPERHESPQVVRPWSPASLGSSGARHADFYCERSRLRSFSNLRWTPILGADQHRRGGNPLPSPGTAPQAENMYDRPHSYYGGNSASALAGKSKIAYQALSKTTHHSAPRIANALPGRKPSKNATSGARRRYSIATAGGVSARKVPRRFSSSSYDGTWELARSTERRNFRTPSRSYIASNHSTHPNFERTIARLGGKLARLCKGVKGSILASL